MGLRTILGVALSLALGVSGALAQGAPPKTRMVMTWVAPYAVDASWTQLVTMRGSAGPKTALTHLGLQFWVPSAAGGLERSSRYGAVSNATIAKFVTWGNRNGVKTLLTVYNGENGWDWTLAKTAFANNRAAFTKALIDEMQLRQLDGIDLDLEGAEYLCGCEYDGDKEAYFAFVRELSKQVRARGKVLTVDTFAYIWNVPNQTWWAELFPLVDAVNSMGYEEIGMRAGPEAWRRYSEQKRAAGLNARKLLLGMPANLGAWHGNTALQQVTWVKNSGQIGVAIWDAQLPHAAWRTPNMWTTLQAISDTTVP